MILIWRHFDSFDSLNEHLHLQQISLEPETYSRSIRCDLEVHTWVSCGCERTADVMRLLASAVPE
jgi:hypothetical protein